MEVLNEKGETVRDGEAVLIGKGDHVRVLLNAQYGIAFEAGEYGMWYAMSTDVLVDEDGYLVLPTGKRCQADGSLVEIYPQNDNCLRFGRTEDCADLEALLNHEHERPRAAQSSPPNDVHLDPIAKQAAETAPKTKDLLAQIRQRLSQGQIPKEAEQPLGGDSARAPVRWLASEFNPTARISDDIRAIIAAMPTEQRGEFVVEGDDWIELHRSNGHRAEGHAVLADRGDRLEIHFGTCGVPGEINAQGQLVLLGAAGEVVETHEPGNGPILCSSEFASVRFERVTDLLSEVSPLGGG